MSKKDSESKDKLMWEEKETFLNSLKKEAQNSASEILYADVITHIQRLDKKDFKKFKKLFLKLDGNVLKTYKYSNRMSTVQILGQGIPTLVTAIGGFTGKTMVTTVGLFALIYGSFLYLGLKLSKGNMVIGIILAIVFGSIFNTIVYQTFLYSMLSQ